MRLIDADALEEGKFHSIENWTPIESASWQRGWNDALKSVEQFAPTVDAVKVVRCKDCAYWGTKVVYANGERADCLNFNFVTPCEFFCKWGERREDDTN